MLDLRKPIGAYFLINAAILIVGGLIYPHDSKIGDLVFNLNLGWGVVMAIFGAFMLGLSMMEKKSKSE